MPKHVQKSPNYQNNPKKSPKNPNVQKLQKKIQKVQKVAKSCKKFKKFEKEGVILRSIIGCLKGVQGVSDGCLEEKKAKKSKND